MILRRQKLGVGVAHVRRHVRADSERVRAHLLCVPHDVLVRLLVRVQRQAQDGILPHDRRLKALSLLRHTRALTLPRVFGFPHRRRRLELVAQHNAEQLHAHHHLVGIGKVQRRRRRRARRHGGRLAGEVGTPRCFLVEKNNSPDSRNHYIYTADTLWELRKEKKYYKKIKIFSTPFPDTLLYLCVIAHKTKYHAIYFTRVLGHRAPATAAGLGARGVKFEETAR